MDIIEAKLSSKELLSSHLGIFKFKPKEKIEFLPGQYVTLGVRRKGLEGPGVKTNEGAGSVFRPYSIVSAPYEDEIELLIVWVQKGGRREDEWGVLTTEIFEQKTGLEYLLRRKPKGKFLLPDDRRDVVMIATGTGLAPFISILRTQNRQNDGRNYFIIHGVSKHSDLSYREELRNFDNVNVTYQRTVSREKCEDCHKSYVDEYFLNRNGNTGRLTAKEIEEAINGGNIHCTEIETVLGKEFLPQNAVIMMCGNPAMLENVTSLAEAKGFQKKVDIITEGYW